MITFEEVPPQFQNRIEGWKLWLPLVAEEYKSKIRILQYYFMSNEEIQAANVRHLGHDYPTDIITFGYEEGKCLAGEMLIGFETIAENAAELGVAIADELDRVLAHGVLHLIGFDDKNEASQQEMRAAEEKCLILRPKILKDK